MMKYWRLYDSAEKEVGFVPQIVDPIFGGYYTDENQLWSIGSRPIDNNSIIPKGHLHKKAKLTDLMSTGFASFNLFVSNKLRQIIEAYPMEGIQFADTEIITKTGEHIKVNVMHPYFKEHDFIDMQDSEFQISNIFGNFVYEQLKFDSFMDFLRMKADLISENKKYDDMDLHKSIRISKLYFKKDADFGSCSMFDVIYGRVGFYVSQNLKDKILEEKCTGVIFREINERYPT